MTDVLVLVAPPGLHPGDCPCCGVSPAVDLEIDADDGTGEVLEVRVRARCSNAGCKAEPKPCSDVFRSTTMADVERLEKLVLFDWISKFGAGDPPGALH